MRLLPLLLAATVASADDGGTPRHFDSWDQCEVVAAKWYARVGQEMHARSEAEYQRDRAREDLRACVWRLGRLAPDGGTP